MLGPGPSPVDESVLEAMAAPVIGHLDPEFLRCMEEIKELLRYVFETENRVALPISGTGSAGMEAAIQNAVEPGDDVVVCVIGFFGERMCEIVERAGGRAVPVRAELGRPADPDQIKKAMDSCRPRALALVHAETSTGVLQDLRGMAELARDKGALLIVDAVTSLGVQPVGADENGIDICYSCTQKGIGAPPGLAPITFSERALERIRSRRSKVRSWYFDITTIEKYWGSDRAYHHTAPISMNYALREALRLIRREGLEARWERHRLNQMALAAGLEAMGLKLMVQPEHRSWGLSVVRVPEGIDDARVRARLLEEHRIEIGGGLGPLKGKVWRIGLMGAGSSKENVLSLLGALHKALNAEGFRCEPGLDAAEAIYSARTDSAN